MKIKITPRPVLFSHQKQEETPLNRSYVFTAKFIVHNSKLNPSQPKVFGVTLDLREIERIFFPLK